MKPKTIGLIALVLFISSAIDNIRNLPATALFGSALIFFFVFSAIVFLFPTGLISAELAARYPEESGIYAWVKRAMGPHMGFLAIWLQWINTMVWYPTILSFIAGTVAYLIHPAWAENKVYLVSVILIVFWALTIVNLKGVHLSAKFAGICTFIGMVIPMIFIVILGLIWLCSGQSLQVHFTAHDLLPSLSQGNNWISLTAIIAAFLGMELATVHVKQVKDPHRTFPRALLISVVFILVTMVLGSLAIAITIPNAQINLVSGVMQTFGYFLGVYHLSFLTPVIGIMILIGSVGGMMNWIISPAKGLAQAVDGNFLPKLFAKENAAGAPTILLIAQAILVSFVCLAFLLMPSVNGSYWLLTDLSTELYLLMYLLMFVAAIVLKYQYGNTPSKGFVIPGGKTGTWITVILGFIGCLVTFVVGFFPPDGIDVGTAAHYHFVFTAGLIGFAVPAVLFYLYRALSKKTLTQH